MTTGNDKNDGEGIIVPFPQHFRKLNFTYRGTRDPQGAGIKDKFLVVNRGASAIAAAKF